MNAETLRLFKFDMYELRYEAWATSKCNFLESTISPGGDKTTTANKNVTPWDLDAHQGNYAAMLAYYSSIFKFLCVALFLIICTEYIPVYCWKRDKMKMRTVRKITVFRRVLCLLLGKIGLVVLSYMSANTENQKFKYLSRAETLCTVEPNLKSELAQIAFILPKI